MSSDRRFIPDNIDVAISGFDRVIEWLLIGLLAFMPLVFGVVHAWSEQIVIVVSGVIVVFFLMKLVWHRDQSLVLTWAYLPLALFILLTVFELIPLPLWLVSSISPNTATTKTQLLGDLPQANATLRLVTLTFYSNATKHALRLVLAAAGVFVVVLNVIRRPGQIKRLLMAIAIIGGVIAVIALAQNLFGNGKIYWFVSSNHNTGYSGPFVNHSHYGQFMNLSIGAALALLFVKLNEAFEGKKISAPIVFEYLGSRSSAMIWILVALISIGAATVFTSLSRGGMVSMLIAMAFTTLLISSRRQSLKARGWVMVAMALIAFVCVLYTGFDVVYDRLATLWDFRESQAGRIQILKDIAVIWTRFPLLGTGLGTHSVVYPVFDCSSITALASHAENEYAQMLEETGLVGLGLLIAFGVIIWRSYAKSVRNDEFPILTAAYGLGFGILAVLIHSLSDFGQHLPANAFLSVIFCALLITLARCKQKQSNKTATAQLFGRSILSRMVVLFGVCAILIWSFIGADNSRKAEDSWKKVRAIEDQQLKKQHTTDAEYEYMIAAATRALEYEPDNIKYLYWLNVYRWRKINLPTDPNTGEFIISDESMPIIRDVVTQFHKACVLCPTYGPTYTVAGQIEKFVLKKEIGAKKIRDGFRLAPCDPKSCFVAGYLDVIEGRFEDCVPKLNKALELDPRLFNKMVEIYLNQLSRPDLVLSIAGDNLSRLEHVARAFEQMQYDDLVQQAKDRILNLLEAECSRSDASARLLVSLASIYKGRGDKEATILCYQRALRLDYNHVQWRMELARLLVETQRIPEAMRHARICLRLRPGSMAAQRLVGDISLQPEGWIPEALSP